MGTRSRIGIKLTDGSILSAYHHYDGYPQWLGRNLVEHFNSYDQASELIDGGDMSVCYSTEAWNSNVIYQTILKSDGTTQKSLMREVMVLSSMIFRRKFSHLCTIQNVVRTVLHVWMTISLTS